MSSDRKTPTSPQIIAYLVAAAAVMNLLAASLNLWVKL
jgi:hypothetical protein